MMNVLGTNIISSLGFTTDENFENVKRGISGLKRYDANTFGGLQEAFTASLIDRNRLNENLSGSETDLEKAVILSIIDANKQANIDLSSEKTIIIISTTKGNVDLLDGAATWRDLPPSAFLWHTAKTVARYFGNPNEPVVVSNACISGAAAQIAAMRELKNGNFDNAVVAGVDFLSKFVISGFQSFKALSPNVCRPFDSERCGLNLGEAAATIIYGIGETNGLELICGAIRNDANHISGPSRTGEGCFRALTNVVENIDVEQIAFINAHGTATTYNDAMEAIAIARAGLQTTPVNSLKGCFGHTLGAAGVLESIISMRALQENMTLKSLNYSEQNFDVRLNISCENHFSDKPCFVKLLSGFGGVNAALLFKVNNNCN